MDVGNYIRFFLALVFVLGLIGLLATAMRRWGFGLPQTPPRKKGHEKRLGLVEIMPLDAKRRLVLFKRDDVEHLVILGTNGETIVETNINAPEPKSNTFQDALEFSISNDAMPEKNKEKDSRTKNTMLAGTKDTPA